MLAEPITRLVYQRGEFGAGSTDAVTEALFWFSFSLPFSGANLLLTRTFFSLQRPWIPTALAGMSLLVNAGVSAALYEPLGIAGIVIGTAVASAAMTVAQAFFLRRELHGFEIGRRRCKAVAAMLAASALLGIVAYEAWTCSTTRSAARWPRSSCRSSRRSRWASRSTPPRCSPSGFRRRSQIIGLIRGRMSRGAS